MLFCVVVVCGGGGGGGVLLLKSLRQILSDKYFIRCDREMLPLLCFLPSKLMGLDLIGCGALFIYHFLYSSILCSRADSLLACRM